MEDSRLDTQPLDIDLSDLQIEDLEVLMQEGTRGSPDFAASCSCCDTNCTCSCSVSCGE